MGLINSIKSVVKKMQDKKDENTRLKEWQTKFSQDYEHYHMIETMDKREQLFLGTHEVDKNINKNQRPSKMSNNVVNMMHELIESQIDVTIPQPTVRSKRAGYDWLAKMVEDSLKNDLQELPINQINDENERTTPIQGYSLIWLDWNPDFKHHLYRGEMEIKKIHPKNLVPQRGVYELQKMDHFFIVLSMTKQYVKDRWGIDVSQEGEELPEFNTISETLDSITINSTDNDNVTVKIALYRKNGDIGRYIWCNNIEIENFPNYYQRRLKRCTKCGKVQVDYTCECGNKKFAESIEEYETLIEDIVIKDDQGNTVKTIPAMSPEYDELGQPTGNMIQTKIPYFTPTMYPLVLRKNIPAPFSFGGISDVDVIQDQFDALKKVVSTIEEKIINGGAIIKMPETMKQQLSGELYQVIKGNITDLNYISVLNLNANIQQDLEFAKYLYDSAKSTLGITDSYQGKADTTAKSGTAKQVQINQSAGRLQSKITNKYTSFKELYSIMFELKLAFYDDVRPYLKKNSNNEDEWGEFNKYAFLEQDKAGAWYYNTDFLFSADAGSGIPKDKMWLQQKTQELYGLKAMNVVQFWTIMESLGFPMAGQIKTQWQEQMKAQEQMQNPQNAVQQIMSKMTPQQQQQFMSLDDDGKAQFINQAMGGSTNVQPNTPTA